MQDWKEIEQYQSCASTDLTCQRGPPLRSICPVNPVIQVFRLANCGTMPLKPRNREKKLLSRRDIETLISEGHKILIFQQKVLKVDAWLRYHPGGDKSILHMVGRDATDEMTTFHSIDALRMVEAYQIGRIEGQWENFLPPIQGGVFRVREKGDCEMELSNKADSTPREGSVCGSPGQHPPPDHNASKAKDVASTTSSNSETDHVTPKPSFLDIRTRQEIDLDLSRYPSLELTTQHEIVQKYQVLHERIKAERLYDCPYSSYAIESCRYILISTLCMVLLRYRWYGTSGMFLGMLWHLLVFTVHDAAHMGITHDYTTDSVIAMTIASYIGGLSASWWKRNHNIHHIVTNSPEHDPDIEHIPFFAISHRFFASIRSTFYDRVMTYDPFAQFFIRFQNYLYYPVLLFGRFNLYRLSWEHLLLGLGPRKGIAWWHRWYELAGQVFFWIWFGYGILYRTIPSMWDRFVFVMVSHMVTMPLHVLFTVSHFAMSTADLGVNESFPQKMLRTTMDIDCPEWLDFFYGGLQFQAIHHLYPRIPRHNLRRTQKLVQEFCEEVGIPYALYGFVDGNKHVLGRLGDVAKQATILAECQKAAAKGILNEH